MVVMPDLQSRGCGDDFISCSHSGQLHTHMPGYNDMSHNKNAFDLIVKQPPHSLQLDLV